MTTTLHPQASDETLRMGRGGLRQLCVSGFAGLMLCSVQAQDLSSTAPGLSASTIVSTSRSSEPGAVQLAADGRTTNQVAGVGYRWWSSHGKADVGVGVGTVGHVVLPAAGQLAAPATLTGSVPSMTLGWRYKVSNASALYADASRAKLSGALEPAQYNAKVGMEWRSAKSDRLGFEPGSLGVHFDSGYRMSLRLRSGGVKMVLRSQF